jgi:hypothetical protein
VVQGAGNALGRPGQVAQGVVEYTDQLPHRRRAGTVAVGVGRVGESADERQRGRPAGGEQGEREGTPGDPAVPPFRP